MCNLKIDSKVATVTVVWIVLALCTICTTSATAGNKTKQQLCVIPQNVARMDCPATCYCYVLSELFDSNVTNKSHVSSNTKLIFLSGDHLVLLNGRLVFQNINNLEITGKSSEVSNHRSNDVRNTQENVTPKIVCNNTSFGILFWNSTNLTLSNITIIGCGAPLLSKSHNHLEIHLFSFKVNCTIVIANSHNATIHSLIVANGRGIGILLYNVLIGFIISHSVFTRNDVNCYVYIAHYAYNGTAQIHKTNITLGNGASIQNTELRTSGIEIIVAKVYSLRVLITDMYLFNNYADDNRQLLLSLHSDVDVELNRCIIVKNGMKISGSNAGNVSVVNSYFSSACLRIDMYISRQITHAGLPIHLKNSTINNCIGTALEVSNTKIVLTDVQISNNVGYVVFMDYDPELTIEGECIFSNNNGIFSIDGIGSNVVFGEGSRTLFTNNVNTCTNKDNECSTIYLRAGYIEVRNASIYIKNNTAEESGGLFISDGTVELLGNSSIVFEDNVGENGGAISIDAGSRVFDSTASTGDFPSIHFIRNKARQKGGAIFIDNLLYTGYSFYVCSPKSHITFHFLNNSALLAGSAVYGNLYYSIMDPYQNPLLGCDPEYIHNIEGEINDSSIISSNPFRVCMCVDSAPNCSITEYESEIHPGQVYKIEVVAVGLRFGTVPFAVKAEYDKIEYSWRSIGGGQYLQHVNNNCTLLRYETVLDSIQMTQLTLTTGNDRDIAIQNTNFLNISLVISFKLKNCSLGFNFSEDQNKCLCQQVLIKHRIECNLETLNEIYREPPKWINATFIHNINEEPGVIVHDHCPFDYCRSDTQRLPLNLEYPDLQCAFNRSGTLCGACQSNLSQVFGTSKCNQCSSLWVILYVPTFALAGFLLVIFLTVLNMTVSIGTINGLIFYANIVRANKAIFFTPETVNSFLSWFIAWLNLDIGLEVCFCHGLDAYVKTWLQFLFPLYIWFIMITIIMLSRHYTTFARLSGSNAVQVLATLFLLSYSKLLRIIITAFQPTVLVYPDGYHRRVWLYDGNVDYLNGKHIPLFIAALLLLVLLSIPYTTVLLTIQWLQKRNQYRVLFWVRKFKPLFDAYTGPYKENHRYWTGLLLLIRALLFLVFSLNVNNNPSVNLLAINTTIIIMLTYVSLIGGMYESQLANTTEVSFLLNLGLLSVATFYQVNTSGDKTQITYTSTGVAFVSFMTITIYHTVIRFLETRRGSKLKRDLMSRFKDNVMDRVNVTAAPTPPPVTRSSIELRESLLVN